MVHLQVITHLDTPVACRLYFSHPDVKKKHTLRNTVEFSLVTSLSTTRPVL